MIFVFGSNLAGLTAEEIAPLFDAAPERQQRARQQSVELSAIL